MQARSSMNSSSLSLVKSKEMLQKITNQIDNIETNRQNSIMIQSIQSSSKKMQNNIDSCIEDNFNTILNSPTLMPLDIAKTHSFQKENNMPTNTTALEGAKALMYQYWERNKKSINRLNKKSCSTKSFNSNKHNDSKLPNINQTSDFRIANYIKAKEKAQQMGIIIPKEEPQEDYHIKIKIIEFKAQNQGKSFFKFQKLYFKRWEQISSILKALQKFAQYYNLTHITVSTKAIFSLIERTRKGKKMDTHDLLGCCENAESMSTQNCNQAGIRFYGKSGKIRAAVVIQSHFRKCIQMRKFKRLMFEWKNAFKIQSFYRSYILRKSFKADMLLRQQQKLDRFNAIQKSFADCFRRNQIKERIKYEIHIPSHNYSQWQKISIEKYLQKQNAQLCRIFKIAENNHLNDVRIIYISPIQLSKDIVKYYNKLLQLASEQKIEHKLTILTPEHSSKLPINLSLSQLLYYSPKTIKKIKSIVRNSYAYIVPSTPTNDYIHLCNELNMPLYSSHPQKLAYLSTRSGCKTFQQKLTDTKNNSIGVLPYSIDIYCESSLLNELTNLIYRYPYVRRWLLKIDNESQSRGIAHIDVYKLMGRLLTNLTDEHFKSTQKSAREEIYNNLQNSLIINKDQRIVPLDKQTYPGQSQYLNHFYTRGGIIEASINNFQTDLQNLCFCVDLQPDGEWKFLCNYYKITSKNKTVAAYYDSNLNKPFLQIEHIISKLKQEKMFGFFTLQFLTINHSLQKTMKKVENKMYYLNSIDCNMNTFSSAHYLRKLVSKDSNTLYVPFIQHPAIKQFRMQTFFHLCRLENISFDIERKVGNVFTFMDGLETGCLGMMTFNETSREDCYSHTAEVLDFLNSKLRQTTSSKDIPASFFSIKNAVNGYLNKNKRMNPKSEKGLDRA